MREKTRRDLMKSLAALAALGYVAPKVVTVEPAEAKDEKHKRRKRKKKRKRPPPSSFPGVGFGVGGEPPERRGGFPGRGRGFGD